MRPASTDDASIARRSVLQGGALATTGLLRISAAPAAAGASARVGGRKSIGIQVGAVSFVDEGVGPVLDLLQERGAIETIYLTTFTYGRGLAGRQVPGQPFPDHGVRESDETFYRGGNYARPHSKFYRNTILEDVRAPDHGDLDIVEAVLPEARKRGLKQYCSVEDVWSPSVPGFDRVAEVDLAGRRAGTLCLMNPDVRHFWTALVTDLC